MRRRSHRPPGRWLFNFGGDPQSERLVVEDSDALPSGTVPGTRAKTAYLLESQRGSEPIRDPPVTLLVTWLIWPARRLARRPARGRRLQPAAVRAGVRGRGPHRRRATPAGGAGRRRQPAATADGGPAATAFLLQVTLEGTGAGAVIAQPGGMCEEACSAELPRGQSVTLTARPSPPSAFSGGRRAAPGKAACHGGDGRGPHGGGEVRSARGRRLEPTTSRAAPPCWAPRTRCWWGARLRARSDRRPDVRGGPGGTPFLARFGPGGEVLEVKSYPPGEGWLGFGALSVGGDRNERGRVRGQRDRRPPGRRSWPG